MKSEKLQKLEDKFGMAKSLVEDLDCLVQDMGLGDDTSNLPVPYEKGELAIPEPENPIEESIIDINCLKREFGLVKNFIFKLVRTGERILESASVLDIADLKASQLDALSKLQVALGANIKLLLECYKDIAAIEKSRQSRGTGKFGGMPVAEVPINTGTINNNQIIFQGSSSDLLKLINNPPEYTEAVDAEFENINKENN